MACVYAPTWDDDKFISSFFSSLPKVDDHYLIIGGDFNLVQDPSLDRSSSNPQMLSKSSKILDTYKTSLGLFDPWRAKSHSDKAFSFFSHVHHSFSRIDFFLLDNYFLSEVHSCEYHSIVISDHAPVSIEIGFPSRVPPPDSGDLTPPCWPKLPLKNSFIRRSPCSLTLMTLQRSLDAPYGKLLRRLCVGRLYHMSQP